MRTSTYTWILGVVVLAACGDDTNAGGTGGTGGDGAGGTGAAAGSGGSPDGGSGGGPDTAAPTTTFVQAPQPGQTNGVPSVFELGCDEPECTFECSLSGAAFAPCDASFAFDPLAAGEYSLAVRATDAAGNLEAPPKVYDWTLGLGFRSVATAESGSCAISGEAALFCWGYDQSGSLGDGPTGPSQTATPLQAGLDTDWEAVFAGPYTFCGRRSSGTISCWGDTYPLGDEMGAGSDVPTFFSDTLVSVAAGSNALCGLDTAGGLHCVGWGDEGLVGDGDVQPHYVSMLTAVGSDTYSQVSMGDEHACAIRNDSQLLCWGLQPVSGAALGVPTPVNSDTDWGRVSAGEYHTCATKASGELYCWGENYDGQLGLGTLDPSAEPTRVGTDEDWLDVFAGESSTCALKLDGEAFCWGANDIGQLGSTVAEPSEVLLPVEVSSPARFRTISGEGDSLCGQSDEGYALCWGRNDGGRLGRGILPEQPTMTLIDDQFDFIASHSFGGCGIAAGSVLCWGRADSNGDPAGLPRATPTAVSPDTDWTKLSVSSEINGHACGIRNQQLYCWGSNNFGQLGNGSTVASNTPTPVNGIIGVTGWSHVSAGIYATCAVATNGDLYCWGFNQYAQLGIGATDPQIPVTMPTLLSGSDWASVEMGGYRVGARGADGSFYYWGVNAPATPTQLAGTDWALVDTTGFGECGIKNDNTLHCTIQGVSGVFPAGAATDWVEIVGPGYPYCALNTQGAVGCFVNNGANNGFVASPAIDPSSGWSQLVNASNGNNAACGLRNGTERHCRGYRELGSLGDGFDERVPTVVMAVGVAP